MFSIVVRGYWVPMGVAPLGFMAYLGVAAIYTVACKSHARRTRQVVQGEIHLLAFAASAYREREPRRCPTLVELVAVAEDQDNARVVRSTDPWERPFVVRCDGRHIEIRTANGPGNAGAGSDAVEREVVK